MKKVLAIVLTLAMLLSSMAVGLSAQRIVSENKTENKYWNFPAGSSYNPVDVGNQGSDFDVEMDIRLDNAEKGLWGWGGLSVGPVFTAKGVGVGENQTDTQVAMSIEKDRWYHVKWDNVGGSTDIYVDGAKVGSVDKTITLYDGNQAFWNWQEISIDNLVVGSYSNDMEDKLNDGQGQSTLEENVTYANENVSVVNNKYWNFPAGSSYNPVDVGNQGSDFDVEMDIRLDNAEKGLWGWGGLSVGPVFTAKGVGVGENQTDTQVAMSIEKDRWYHVKWDNVGGSTDIYVDGAKVGSVDKTITLYDGNQAFWNWQEISIDNLKVGSYSNDMENMLNDGQGQSTAYPAPKVDTIFDHFETKEVGGEAVLIDQTPAYGASDNNTYLDADHFANKDVDFRVNQGSFIMNFDLAVLPNSDSSDGSCFETWTNRDKNGTNLARWKVGVMPTADGLKGYAGMESGSTKDFVEFDWGEATIKNFHNVTYFIDFEHNIGEIYVDKNLVYTGKAGAKAWDNMIFMPHNASCVLDNIQLMDLEYNSLGSTNFSEKDAKIINLDAADFCAENGHISGKLTRTAEPKCYEEGNDAIACAVCGEVKTNVSVAKVAHVWESYDIGRTNSQGLVTTSCKNPGCTEQRYTSVPEKGTYTGTLKEYYDMTNDMVLVVDNSWNGEIWKVVESDGRNVLRFGAGTGNKPYENNYNYFDPTSSVGADNWSWNFDIVYNGTPWYIPGGCDTYEDGKPGYGHVLYFWVGGENGTNAIVGYNNDVHKLYLTPNASAPNTDNPTPVGAFGTSTDFTMVEGEKYNIQISVAYNVRKDLDDAAAENEELWDDPEFLKEYATQFAYLKLYVNGVEYINWHYEMFLDEDGALGYDGSVSALTYIPSPGRTNPLMVLRNFGMSIDVLSMAIGTADFAYTDRTYAGDVDGDNYLTAADALSMRKYLARVFGDSDIQTSRADANGDGVLNAKDQLVIRKALAK